MEVAGYSIVKIEEDEEEQEEDSYTSDQLDLSTTDHIKIEDYRAGDGYIDLNDPEDGHWPGYLTKTVSNTAPDSEPVLNFAGVINLAEEKFYVNPLAGQSNYQKNRFERPQTLLPTKPVRMESTDSSESDYGMQNDTDYSSNDADAMESPLSPPLWEQGVKTAPSLPHPLPTCIPPLPPLTPKPSPHHMRFSTSNKLQNTSNKHQNDPFTKAHKLIRVSHQNNSAGYQVFQKLSIPSTSTTNHITIRPRTASKLNTQNIRKPIEFVAKRINQNGKPVAKSGHNGSSIFSMHDNRHLAGSRVVKIPPLPKPSIKISKSGSVTLNHKVKEIKPSDNDIDTSIATPQSSAPANFVSQDQQVSTDNSSKNKRNSLIVFKSKDKHEIIPKKDPNTVTKPKAKIKMKKNEAPAVLNFKILAAMLKQVIAEPWHIWASTDDTCIQIYRMHTDLTGPFVGVALIIKKPDDVFVTVKGVRIKEDHGIWKSYPGNPACPKGRLKVSYILQMIAWLNSYKFCKSSETAESKDCEMIVSSSSSICDKCTSQAKTLSNSKQNVSSTRKGAVKVPVASASADVMKFKCPQTPQPHTQEPTGVRRKSSDKERLDNSSRKVIKRETRVSKLRKSLSPMQSSRENSPDMEIINTPTKSKMTLLGSLSKKTEKVNELRMDGIPNSNAELRDSSIETSPGPIPEYSPFWVKKMNIIENIFRSLHLIIRKEIDDMMSETDATCESIVTQDLVLGALGLKRRDSADVVALRKSKRERKRFGGAGEDRLRAGLVRTRAVLSPWKRILDEESGFFEDVDIELTDEVTPDSLTLAQLRNALSTKVKEIRDLRKDLKIVCPSFNKLLLSYY